MQQQASINELPVSLHLLSKKQQLILPANPSTGMLGSHSFSLLCKMQQHTYGTACLFFLHPSFVNTAASSLLSDCQFLCIYHYPSYANAATCFLPTHCQFPFPLSLFRKMQQHAATYCILYSCIAERQRCVSYKWLGINLFRPASTTPRLVGQLKKKLQSWL